MVSNTRILIVDDDPEKRRTLERTLIQADYQVTTAASGTEALRLIRRELPALILLDGDLGDGAHGLEACRTIKDDPELASCYVVLISNYHTDSEAQASGLDLCADGYIARPIANRELIARIEATLRIRRAEVTLREHERLQRQLEEARVAQQREWHEKELRSYDEISTNQGTPVTAQLLGLKPLRDTDGHTFETLISAYSNILDQAVEQHTYRVNHDVSEALHAMSEHLGQRGAGPRDVIDIHSVALQRKAQHVAQERMQAYLQEGRLTSLELMGYLVKYYRARAVNSFLSNHVDPHD